MKTTTLATAEAAPPPAVPLDLPKIDPGLQRLQYAGLCFSEYVLILPPEMSFDILGKEPGIFLRVQNGRYPLRELDRLVMISADRAWIATATVATSRPDGVVLFQLELKHFPTSYDRLPETNEFRVVHDALGYRVQRKKDLVWMSQAVHTISMANRDLENLYPRRLS